MALTVSSPRVFNGNVGKQAYGSTESTSGSKCICCPYGYHIDLDFVEYCEAVAAGNIDKNTIERRKKRERRRQCQSMEILLGLVSPTFSELENELSKISQQDEGVSNGVTTLPRSGHQTSRPGGNNPHPYHHQHSTALDLSDVVGDFEATLQRLSKPYKNYDRRNQSETVERGRGIEDLKNKYDPQVEDKIVKYCKNIQFLFIDEKIGKYVCYKRKRTTKLNVVFYGINDQLASGGNCNVFPSHNEVQDKKDLQVY
ncbi:hypothetical protein KQX54_001941 [Cotesia glomerata]|uniref:Uncharacterized protein n=1 Tax=Cotesia glomerata TaxID=32391 RepID=A0AAV7HNB9_COTGL|nr:hypothetical protein KQX54_001941 [Cotesia glomerata]